MSIVALFSLASCQKEESGKVLFTGSIEKATVDSKTSIQIDNATNEGKVVWESGDQVAIYDQGVSYTLEAIPTGDYTTADFAGDATPSGGPYYAIYPAGIATGFESITLPAEQTCTDGTHFTAPMYAYSTTSDLVFKNLCGVLQLNLPAVNKIIANIELTTPNNNICGDFAVDYNGGNPQLNCTANGGHKLTLNCGEQGMDCSQGLTFYIYLPAGDYTEMTFAIEATDYSCCLKHFEDASNPITIVRNTYYPTTFSTANNGFVFIDPAELVDGPIFQSVTDAAYLAEYNNNNTILENMVFEYKSPRPAGTTLLSTADSPAPIYYTVEGTTMIVYTPAARMNASANCEDMFNATFSSRLRQLDLGGIRFNTENVTNMRRMFAYNNLLLALDVSHFNTENVINMAYMFTYCQSLGSLDLSNFNAESVTTMDFMFYYFQCKSLNLTGFTTSSALTSTRSMFCESWYLTGSLDISGIDFSNVRWQNVTNMFQQTAKYNENPDWVLPIYCSAATKSKFENRNFSRNSYLDYNGYISLQQVAE